jgi:hypothetical protein
MCSLLHRTDKNAPRLERRFRIVHNRARRAEFYLKGRTAVFANSCAVTDFSELPGRLPETSLHSSLTRNMLPSRRQFWGRAAGRLQPSGWQALFLLSVAIWPQHVAASPKLLNSQFAAPFLLAAFKSLPCAAWGERARFGRALLLSSGCSI